MIARQEAIAMIQGMSGRRSDPTMVNCDKCNRMMSVRGLKMQEMTVSKYRIQFFACPWCGSKYLVACTDSDQRKKIECRKGLMLKIRLGVQKHFKEKTINGYRAELDKLDREIKERNVNLNRIGTALLRGEKLEDILAEEAKEEHGHGTD